MVPDPGDQKYHVSVDVELPAEFRTKVVAAAYIADTKVEQSETTFSASGPVELALSHPANANAVENFSIRIGYDADNNHALDPSEQFKFSLYTDSDKQHTGELIVRGIGMSAFAANKNAIKDYAEGTLVGLGAPNAQTLLLLFYDGNTARLSNTYRPNLPEEDIQLDGFADASGFSEWLTHDAGANFSDEGVATIKRYVWSDNTPMSTMIALARPLKDIPANQLVQNRFNQIAGQAIADMRS